MPKAQTSVKSNVTSQNKNLQNELRHDKTLGGMGNYGSMHGEAWARPQNLNFDQLNDCYELNGQSLQN